MKFKILTYGCAMNKADSEFIAGIIKSKFSNEIEEYFVDETKNFQNIEDIENDFLIINTCIVKQPTENKILNLMRKIEKRKIKNVIIAGCLPAAYPEICSKYKFSFIGTNVSDIDKAIEETIKGKKFVQIAREENKLVVPKFSFNNIIYVLPISEGCLNNCSYCSTKLARKNLISYPEDEIVNKVQEAINYNFKEIWLTSQDTGNYGADIGTNIVNLLKKIKEKQGKFKVRIGMMNPKFALTFLNPLIKILEDEKFYKFVHIPVQSGSNKVLSDMNRNYKVEDFIKVVEAFKAANFSISTDIIVGFPTETDEDFNESVKLIEKIKPDFLNLSKFYIRKGTVAEKNIKNKKWKFNTEIAKKRALILSKIFKKISIENNKKWLNWEGEVLIDEIENANYISRNFAYKKIHLKGCNNFFGKFVNCKIVKAGEILEGVIIQ